MACPSSHEPAPWSVRWAPVALLLLFAVMLVGCAVGGRSSVTRVPTPTWPNAAGAPGVTTAATAGWSQYRDPTYSYVTEFPSDATMRVTPVQSGTSLTSWRFANQQGSADTATLEVTATTQANPGLCAQYTSGKPVTLAGGVTGYQQDNLSGGGSASASSQPQVAVVVVHSGLLTIITLTGAPPASTFMQRWGADWSHILSAFQPGQGPASAKPCA